MSSIHSRLAELGLVLPEVPMPTGPYAAWRRSGDQLWMSGMVPMTAAGILHPGLVGETVSVEAAQEAAVVCVMNSLSLAARALGGDVDRIAGCLKLTGFVRCREAFTGHPAVINAASQRVVDLLGEAGLHARMALGTPSLPAGAPVLLDIVWLAS